ncbi:MAG TPA: periplasmic heavy metal sensor [Pyrinomonadaceae bacterium]
MLALFGLASAQDGPPPAGGAPPDDTQSAKRPNLLRILGISPEQQQAVRRINQRRKPLMEAATARLRAANQALDDAIYSDNVDESVFQARLKDVHAAQAEVVKLRFTSELEIRKILTPDQLSRFRELRQRFQQANQGPDGRPRPMKGRPMRQLRDQMRQKPPA